ncbi:sensor histidine kinase [uncultured Lacinutrix sp.]|uniref:sensor histidine kinase n=1 Tax=uncultured Lacinutrix sp. TaxID=574032 RepID=UPI00260EF204|nr:histidine kinase [uncultured Lacinutrix sp.]
MKLSLNKYYLIFSLIGWVFLFFITLALRKMIGVETSPERVKYLIAESVACGILAYLTTFIVSLHIDYKIDFNNIKRLDIYKVIGLFIIIQLIYSWLLWPLLDMVDFWGGSRGKSGDMTFIPLLYNAIYFATLYIIWLFVFLTIKMYHHLNVVKVKQLQLESNLKESQLNTLKGQINPHFMFNTLNNIRGLMLEDVSKARNMLTNLSETLRYSLTKSDVDSIALEDELEMVENYIAISKIQLEERLQFQTEIDPNTLSKQIPPMIIQMLIENAIKHGISNLKTGGILSLNTHINNNVLEIVVANPGQLKETKNTTRLGLKNIKRRLELLYGDSAIFNLKEVDARVIATVKIPLA